MINGGMIQLLQQLLADSREREKSSEKRADQATSESKELRLQIRELQAQLNHVISLLEKSNKTSEQLANELKLYSPKKCEKITNGIKENQDAELHGSVDTSPGETSNQEQKKPSRWVKAKSRGNNNAKRKEYFCTEVRDHDIWPQWVNPADRESTKVLRQRMVVRYGNLERPAGQDVQANRVYGRNNAQGYPEGQLHQYGRILPYSALTRATFYEWHLQFESLHLVCTGSPSAPYSHVL